MNSRCLLLLLCAWAGLAPAQDIRNVLFLTSDDLRANALGCYGNAICATPNIDRLAREGMVFEHAYCQGTVCAPSRQSLMYSRYRGDAGHTLGEHFQRHGRYSARVGKIFHMRVPGDIIAGTDGADVPACWTERFNSPGLEAHTAGDYACLNLNVFTKELAHRESTKMPHRMYVSVQIDGDGSDQPDHKTATKTIALLEKHRDRPFFLAAGFVRPHYPMVAPRSTFDAYPWAHMPLPEQRAGDWEDIPPLGIPRSTSASNGIDRYPDNQKRMWAAYYATVTFMDAQVGRILNALDRLGLRESTAIVFTSDHGYHLGDHGFWLKGDLHEHVTRVPLIIAAPTYAPGRSKSLTELVDLYPTLCELTGIPIPAHVQGKSLVPILSHPEARVKDGALSFARGHGWRTSQWAYMRYPDGGEELYHMNQDPDQFTNLVHSQEHQDTITTLRRALAERLQEIE